MERAELRLETFAPHVGGGFTLPDGTTLRLAGASPAGDGAAPGGRSPFSLLFCGPADRPLAQGTHELQHATLGDLALFLVPVGRAGDELQYEAVFA